ncbi:hypothetical protein GCM10027060_00810 [Nesterenkonia halophila]|uniref:hypothetical protein n=1 Tax=Nesterenkonia halophila TaxID=302044 RepID=UPI0012927363|nr:hypothetical protein [Nesterenkonia halophila]
MHQAKTGELFTVVDLDDPDNVESSASALKTATADVARTVGEAARTWGGLESSYRAPETGELLTALDPAAEQAGELARAGNEADSAIGVYAAQLRDLHTRRRALLADIEDFRTMGADAAAVDDGEAHDLRVTGLQQRCRDLAEEKDAAQNRCAAALGAITTSVSTVRGSRHQVPQAAEADDVATSKSALQDRVGNVGQTAATTTGSVFGASAADAVSFGLQKGVSAVGTTADAVAKSTSTMNPRQAWAPAKLRDMAAMGERSRRAVAAVTGWDASSVTAPDRRLAADDARNPFRRPHGVKDAASALRGRFFASLSEQNRVAKPGMSGRFDVASKMAKGAAGAGGVLTFATGAVGQWNEDSAAHPEMEWEEQSARAGTVGFSAMAGGWAGAKAGAAAGAAIGSFFPGPGTAIGAVAGGVIGGIAGSAVGKELGEGFKDLAGDTVDAVSDGVEKAWDSVTSLF